MGRGAAGQRSASFRLRESDAGGVGITIHDSGIVSSGIFRWHETPAVVGRSLSWQAEPVRDEQQTVILAAMGNKCHVWFKGRYYRFDVEGRTERGGIGFGWLDGNANMVIEQAEYRVLE